MGAIQTALLSGHRKVEVNGILIELQPLKHDTYKNKLREAEKRAKEILKLIS